jgi:cytoskeletal protein RodZ
LENVFPEKINIFFMLFTHKKIKDAEAAVAEKLRVAREEKKVTIEFVAQKLGINQEYLSALENGDYNRLPAGVYEKTYLKKYGAYLGLNLPRLEEKYLKEKGLASKEKKNVFAKRKINAREMLVFPKILKNILVIIFVVALFLYLGIYLKNSFSQPKMFISSPADKMVTENNTVDVIGQADTRTQITINNKQIIKDESGNFRETVDLIKGLNTITISAQNKYGRKKIIEKQILVK